MRGDYPNNASDGATKLESPPLARGLWNWVAASSVVHGITPACAGTIFVVGVRLKKNKNHPRLRGDYVLVNPQKSAKVESPPLARGLYVHGFAKRAFYGITPACAGTIYAAIHCCQLHQNHPRLRGDYFDTAKFAAEI